MPNLVISGHYIYSIYSFQNKELGTYILHNHVHKRNVIPHSTNEAT